MEMTQTDESIKRLIAYARKTALIEESDVRWAINSVLCELRLTETALTEEEIREEQKQIPEEAIESGEYLEETLRALTDYAVREGRTEGDSVVFRDLFDTKLMGLLTPRPSELIRRITELYREDRERATDAYYRFSQDTDYIRRYRIRRDLKWKTETEYGALDITINLSKPEKDPKAIAAAGRAKQSGYPKCQLCRECEGYSGRADYPARENHRILPIRIQDENWGFQYSPYVYYNEHCIVFNQKHTPMKIDEAAFRKLFDFVSLFPHYFVGSNADLPIVGGSILSHEHFQGGHYRFAMAEAPVERFFTVRGFEDITAGIVKWPMSVIRLSGEDSWRLAALAGHILACWRAYTDETAFVFAETDGVPHSTITPIARRAGDRFQLDLVLRNNITTEEHPLGVFHPHAELHHIKKENIGLIEVMGLAVLPARLREEMALLRAALLSGREIEGDPVLGKHAEWVREFSRRCPAFTEENIEEILRAEIGRVFLRVLEDAGVFKRTAEGQAAFDRFTASL
ncbi:MAG: UDP-glucose--hexose-1-phosphate uridylyltransferase [Oribacterium sp.]